MGNPLVTIVTPSLNQGQYIANAMDSVACQTYKNIEYIVADGGSTDKSIQRIQTHRYHKIWWSRPDDGQSNAINQGFIESRGSIFMWLNSDDTLLPHAVEWAVEQFNRYPYAGVVYGDTYFTDPDGTILFPSKNTQAIYEQFVVNVRNPISQPSAFIRSSVFSGLNDAYKYFMDWDLWLRIGRNHDLVYNPCVVSTYRLHDASKTSGSVCFAHELKWIYDSYFGYYSIAPNILRQKRRAYANMYARSAEYYAHSGLRWIALMSRAMSLLYGGKNGR